MCVLTCRRWWCLLQSSLRSSQQWHSSPHHQPLPLPSSWSLEAPLGPKLNSHTHTHRNSPIFGLGLLRATLFRPLWRPWLTWGKGYVDPFLQPTSQRLVDVPGKVGGSEDHDHLRGVLILGVAHTWLWNRNRDIQIWPHGTTTVIIRMVVGKKEKNQEFFFMNSWSVALTIHLNQKLGLYPAAGLVFVWGSSPATDGVNLIYEDGCWCVKPSLGHTKVLPDAAECSDIHTVLPEWRPTISKSTRTSFSDSPLYLEVSVEEDTLKKVVPHSVATALANMVFPVPGGPTIKTP